MVVECVCKRGGWWCTTIGGDIKDKWERKKMVHDQFNSSTTNLFGQSFPKFPIKLIWPTNWHRLNFARDWPNNCTSSSSSDNHWHYHHNHRPHDDDPLVDGAPTTSVQVSETEWSILRKTRVIQRHLCDYDNSFIIGPILFADCGFSQHAVQCSSEWSSIDFCPPNNHYYYHNHDRFLLPRSSAFEGD